MKTNNRPCPVCEALDGVVITNLNYALFDDLNMSGNKTLLQCTQCGMLYDDVNFSDNQLQEYYRRNEHYAVSGLGGSGSNTKDNEARYKRIINLLTPDSSGTIIDFGCGQGGFIGECLKYGLNAVGIEASAKSRQVAQEAGLCVYESVNDFVANNAECRIQAVVFSHVLEHVMDPIALLRDVARHAFGAVVYIEVPDADAYLSPVNVRWQEMYFEHLSHFRRQNIADLARLAAIEIINEGETPFSESQNDTRCRFVVGRFVAEQRTAKIPYSKFDHVSPISFEPAVDITEEERPLGLWGLSQYAMLLLGSCPELAGPARRIFDASSAKIGRSVLGIVVESPDGISTLSSEFILLIPASNSLSQMRDLLPGIGFKGKVVEV